MTASVFAVDPPGILNYQGVINADGVPFTGTGLFCSAKTLCSRPTRSSKWISRSKPSRRFLELKTKNGFFRQHFADRE
jgi:hypothetical protein